MITFIRIEAQCEFFTINEMVDENKAVARLLQIRKLFESITKPKTVRGMFGHKTQLQGKPGKLIVKTEVLNPTIF